MFFKGVILDLDDTLYDHSVAQNKAYKKVNQYLKIKYNLNIYPELNKIKKLLKNELNTASSHNRFIYFKKIVENTNIPFREITIINDIFWEEFFQNISLRGYTIDFLNNLKGWGKKIIILTNFQTEYQIKKLEKLNILNLVDYIITSEEVGYEKPSFKMFDEVLRKTDLRKEELIMIGDDLIRDIQASKDYGIYAFHFNFIDFYDLNFFFTDLNRDINDFTSLCNFVGNRFDLVQLGGGNISIKNSNLMIIKSSGVNMKNITNEKGYSVVLNDKLKKDLKKDKLEELENYLLFNKNKSSIETYMHVILKKYTVHLHPLEINKILVRKNAREILEQKYPGSIVLDYISPGLEVAKALSKKDYKNTNLIFLLNHGIILTSNDIEEIYKMINDFKRLEYKEDYYLCQDIYLNSKIDIIKKYYDKYCFPDAVIYLKNKYYIARDKIYLKDKKIEEILKANVMILDGEGEIEFLDEEEVQRLYNREDEKYRFKYFQ